MPTSRPLKRFIQAFERADAVSSTLFEQTTSLWLLSSQYGEREPKKKRLKPFKVCGIHRSSFQYLGAVSQKDNEYIDDDVDSEIYRHWDAFELVSRDHLRDVLWLSLGGELGISPAFHGRMYIVDFERNLVLHPYDDRGMDVVAMKKEDLSSLYTSHRSWLLEYSMDKMKDVFES